jgi:hypothetical protein
MKTLFMLFFSLVLFIETNAQEKLSDALPVKDNKVIYTNIVQADSISKNELYKRAKKWLANSCEVIVLDDKDELIGRSYIDFGNDIYLWQTVRIFMKEQKYKYEITDFRVKKFVISNVLNEHTDQSLENYTTHGSLKEFYKNIDSKILEKIVSIGKAMKTPIDDNW